MGFHTTETEDSLFLTLAVPPLPTIGANGFFIRKSALDRLPRSDYLFDVDVLPALIRNRGPVKIAKVKTGIIHIYGTGHRDFVRKQTRRIQDFFYYKQQRSVDDYIPIKFALRISWFCIFAVLFFPNLIWAGITFLKRKDIAILYHPIACLTTFIIYIFNSLRHLLGRSSPYERRQWSQVNLKRSE